MATTFVRPVQLALDYEQRVLWAVTLFPLLAVALIAACKLTPRLYMAVIREDGLVEWATALVYCVATAFAVSLVFHFWRDKEKIYALLYGILAIGMFFVAMEEISWGQRQLGLETPDTIRDINYKGEFNLHNVSSFPLHESYIVVGLYGAFSRLISTSLLRIRNKKFINLLTPPYALCLYFFIPFAYYAYTEILYYTVLLPSGLQWSDYWNDEHFIIGKDQEPLELLLSFGFLLFTMFNWIRYRVGAPLTLRWSADAAQDRSSDPIP